MPRKIGSINKTTRKDKGLARKPKTIKPKKVKAPKIYKPKGY